MPVSTPEPYTPGGPVPLSRMDAYVTIIENIDIASVVLGFFFEGQPVPFEDGDQVTCNDVELPYTKIGYLANVPRVDSGGIYKFQFTRGERSASLLLFTTFRPKITSPAAGESVSRGQGFTIRYNAEVGDSVWVRAGAVLYLEGEAKQNSIGDYDKEPDGSYTLDTSGFTPGDGLVWLERQVIYDFPALYFSGVQSFKAEYTALEKVTIVWR